MKKVVLVLVIISSVFNRANAQYLDFVAYRFNFIADSLSDVGEYEKAISYYNFKNISKTHLNGEVQFKKAVAYYYLKNDVEALKSLKSAIDLKFTYYSVASIKKDNFINFYFKDTTDLHYRKLIDNTLRKSNSNLECTFPIFRDSLNKMKLLDQKYRKMGSKNESTWKSQIAIDSLNQIAIINVIKEIKRFPNYLDVGVDGVQDLMLMISHSNNLIFLDEMLNKINQTFIEGGIDPTDYALFYDKWFYKRYQIQIFGTQVDFDSSTKTSFCKPLLFPNEINMLRQSFSLIPLQEYLGHMNNIHRNEK